MLTGTSMSDGVLADRELRQAVRDGWIVSPVAIDDQQFQPASLDLRLGPDAYQLRASFLPFRESVQGRLGERGLAESDLVIDQLSLTGSGATLQRGSVYLVPLLESLDLPPDVRGRSNPKSTSCSACKVRIINPDPINRTSDSATCTTTNRLAVLKCSERISPPRWSPFRIGSRSTAEAANAGASPNRIPLNRDTAPVNIPRTLRYLSWNSW